MGRFIPEAQNNNIREIIFKPYRIIYIINEDCIEILTIVNSR